MKDAEEIRKKLAYTKYSKLNKISSKDGIFLCNKKPAGPNLPADQKSETGQCRSG